MLKGRVSSVGKSTTLKMWILKKLPASKKGTLKVRLIGFLSLARGQGIQKVRIDFEKRGYRVEGHLALPNSGLNVGYQ